MLKSIRKCGSALRCSNPGTIKIETYEDGTKRQFPFYVCKSCDEKHEFWQTQTKPRLLAYFDSFVSHYIFAHVIGEKCAIENAQTNLAHVIDLMEKKGIPIDKRLKKLNRITAAIKRA
jgi:hypothetical protein